MPAPKGNKYAVGAGGGRPPKFKSAKALTEACEEYFVFIEGECHFEKKEVIDEEGNAKLREVQVWDRYPEPATITGLALYLGFADRQSLTDYKEKEEFSCIIKRAKFRVEHEYEKALARDKPTGAIFALKNMGWNDKLDVTSDGEKLSSTVTIFELPNDGRN